MKQRAFLLTFTFFLAIAQGSLGSLPPIEVKKFDIKPVKSSTSKRVYLFDDATVARPEERRIVLLRQQGANAMAFRVIKVYPEKNQFAAARVRTYPGQAALNLDTSYEALLKLGDLPPPAGPAEQKQNEKDLEELEGDLGAAPPPPVAAPDAQDAPTAPAADDAQIAAVDADLEAAPPPEDPELTEPPPVAENSEAAEPSDEDMSALTYKESVDFDPDSNWLSGELMYFRNVRNIFFAAAGIRYGFTLAKNVTVGAPTQSSWALDLGAHFYTVLNYQYLVTGDTSFTESYNLLPLSAAIRYNILLSEDFGVFFYGGVMYTLLVAAVGSLDESVAELGGMGIATGAGMIYRFGPRWHLRADVGLDRIGMAVMLRF